MISVSRSGGFMFFSIVFAFVLQTACPPHFPEWLLLVFLYWAIKRPSTSLLFYGYLAGLCLDAYQGTLFGSHAGALVLAIFPVMYFYYRLVNFLLIQQTLCITIFAGLYQMMLYVVYWVQSTPPQGWAYWIPSMMTLIAWPILRLLTQIIERNDNRVW